MKIAFSCKLPLSYGYTKLAERIKSKSKHCVLAISYNSKDAKLLNDSGIFSMVYSFPEFMRLNISKFPSETVMISELNEVEKQAGYPIFSKAITSDRTIYPSAFGTTYKLRKSYRYDELLKFAYGSLKFWTAIQEKEKIDRIVGEISNLAEVVSWCLRERLGLKHVVLAHTRIMPNRLFVYDNPIEFIGRLDNRFSELKKRGLNDKERSEAEAFLTHFKERRLCSFINKNPLRLDYARVYRIIKQYSDRWKIKSHPAEHTYDLDDFDNSTLKGLMASRIGKALRYFVSNYSFQTKINTGDKFFLYNLHVQPENSTLMHGSIYENQLFLIEVACKGLPAGYKLYVKEHPDMGGRRLKGFYRFLLRLPNIVLLHPSHNSHELIEASSGIITISGTTGLEGIMYQKPVMILGHAGFTCFDNIFRVDNLKDLSKYMHMAINSYQPNKESLLIFIQAILQASYHGELYSFSNPYEFGFGHLTEENIDNIWEAIDSFTKSTTDHFPKSSFIF